MKFFNLHVTKMKNLNVASERDYYMCLYRESKKRLWEDEHKVDNILTHANYSNPFFHS